MSSRHRIMLWTFKISQKCVKRLLHPVGKKKIKGIKQQQRLLRWKTRSVYSNPAWHLSSTFWCVFQYLFYYLPSLITLQTITSDDPLKINLSTLYENSYFKTFPVGGLRLEERRIILEVGSDSDCGQFHINGFLHGGTRRMLPLARSGGLLDAFLGNLQQKATLESRWCNPESHGCCLQFRHLWQVFGCWPTCLIFSYLLRKLLHCAPPGTAPGEGRKGEGKVHIDEIGSLWAWKVQTQTGEQERLWLGKVALCMYINIHICMPVYAVYLAFLRTSENYFYLPARKLHPVIILDN